MQGAYWRRSWWQELRSHVIMRLLDMQSSATYLLKYCQWKLVCLPEGTHHAQKQLTE